MCDGLLVTVRAGRHHNDASANTAATAALRPTIDPRMTQVRRAARHGNAYEIFILVLTLFSLLLMALQLLPLDENTRFLVSFYDNAACILFLMDFTYNMARTRPRSDYFIGQRGWLDLLGSIPALGSFSSRRCSDWPASAG